MKKEAEIIAEIIKLEKTAAKRKKDNKLKYYNTGFKVHLKQMDFHKCLKRNRWVFGGNRSGKSECGAVEAVWLARGIHPYRDNRDGVSGWVVSLSREVQRDVAQGKILDYLNPEWIADIVMVSGKSSNPRGGVIDFISVYNVFGGLGRIGFKSCDQGREKFQGMSLDFVWFDEEPPEDIYDECRMRVIDRRGEIFGTMTPLLGLTFVYGKIYMNEGNDPNVWCQFMEWADNPYLDEKEISLAANSMTVEQLQARRYGKFVCCRGLVYPEFNESIHVIKPFDAPIEWYDNLSIDPGLNNPLACHWYAVDGDGTVYVVAEHFQAGKDVSYHSNAIIAQSKALKWHTDSGGRINALIDSASNQRTLAYSKSVAQLFFENNINVNTKVNKDLFTGINRVKSYLQLNCGKPKIYIFDTCVNLIRELKSYWWGENDAPKKRDDHCLDELRYYIMSKPEPYVKSEEKGELQQYKDKLIKRLKRKIRL